jgi:hypothetical protein
MATGAAPVVDVNYGELTYELLLEEQKDEMRDDNINPNKATTPMQRVFSDIFGLAFLYIGTFLFCNLLRTIKTGHWSKMIWMFMGPYKMITGAPLFTKWAENWIDKNGDPVGHCQSVYDNATRTCNTGSFLLPGPFHVGTGGDDYDECMAEAQTNLNSCLEQTPAYADCVNQMNEIWDTLQDSPIKFNSGIDDPQSYCLDSVGGNPE